MNFNILHRTTVAPCCVSKHFLKNCCLQVDLGGFHTICAIITDGQAMTRDGTAQSWVSAYDIYVSKDGTEGSWQYKVLIESCIDES